MPKNYITNILYISVNYFNALNQLTLITYYDRFKIRKLLRGNENY